MNDVTKDKSFITQAETPEQQLFIQILYTLLLHTLKANLHSIILHIHNGVLEAIYLNCDVL
jgi:hypothetical protein